MTVIRPNSITGITSITALNDTISVYKSDGTTAGLQLDGVNFNTTGVSTVGQLNVGTGGTVITTTAGGDINIDSGGVYYDASNNRFGIGTTTVNADLHTYNSSGDSEVRITSNSSNEAILRFGNTVDQTLGSIRFESPTDSLVFYGNNDTEAFRVDSSRRLLVGTDSAINSAHTFASNVNNSTFIVNNTTSSGFIYGLQIRYTNQDPNNTGNSYLECYNASSSTLRAEIRSNGGLANYSAFNANLSDRNVKKDIVAAAGTWDCLKEWEIVNFRYKDQLDDADLNMGVIAQQVAESCPEVITVFQEAKEATEDHPAQEERLGVKDQQMMWMAIKALQEAQLRIETLEAEVAALKAQ